MKWSNGNDYSGSGAAIGRRLILTCAHNLSDANSQGHATGVWFCAGFNAETPGIYESALRTACPSAYHNGEPDSWDVGLVLLQQDLPDYVTQYFIPQITTERNASNLVGTHLHLLGYPGNKKGEMWTDYEKVDGVSVPNNFMIYGHDDDHGSSGSPLYSNNGDDVMRQYGIHIQQDSHAKAGLLITEPVYEWITQTASALLSGEPLPPDSRGTELVHRD